jgi:hypothetical protein
MPQASARASGRRRSLRAATARQRQHDVEAHGGLAAGRPRDHEEAGDANCGGDHPAQQYPVPALAQEGVDQDSEDQVTDQERLDQRQRPEPQRQDLQREADQRSADRRQPERLPDEVDEDPRRQRPAALHALGTALIGDGSDPEDRRGTDGDRNSR